MQITAKILAVYFLLGSFLPRTDFSQLLRVHNLVTHYKVHVLEARDKGMEANWFDFLSEHFLTPNQQQHHHHDGSGHHNLPLQSVNSGLNLIVTDFEFRLPSIPAAAQTIFPSEEDEMPLGFKTAIFQPPTC